MTIKKGRSFEIFDSTFYHCSIIKSTRDTRKYRSIAIAFCSRLLLSISSLRLSIRDCDGYSNRRLHWERTPSFARSLVHSRELAPLLSQTTILNDCKTTYTRQPCGWGRQFFFLSASLNSIIEKILTFFERWTKMRGSSTK